MVEFAGYDMPIWYTSTLEEHMAVRNRAGIFDVSHMARVNVTGPDAGKYIEHLFPTSIQKHPSGKSVYTLMLNDDAGIIDDLIVLKMSEDWYLLVVNAACKSKDLKHMEDKRGGFDVELGDITDTTTMIAVQGPLSVNALQPLTLLPLAEMKRFTHAVSTVKTIRTVITRTGYTGEDGFEIILYDAGPENEGLRSIPVWEALMKNAIPCALGARDTLRLEAGLPLYGSDMDETTNPLEAELGWVISKDKQSYIGWPRVASLLNRSPARVRRGIIMDDKVPRHGFKITDDTGTEIGSVTSGTFSPLLKKGIAMGYIRTPSPQPGDMVKVVVRDAPGSGKIVRFPFYDDSKYGWKRNKTNPHQ
jgi:aminomethyltransferase